MTFRFWVVAVGEPLPTDPNEPRLLRAGILARLLAEAGHEVTWWTSNVDHTHKRRRYPNEAEIELGTNLRLILLDGVLYQSNVSLAQIRNHRQVAAAFARRSELEPKPDVILCSFPTIELAREAALYGRRHNVSVALDVRDLWPDALVELAPTPLRSLAKLLLQPMRRDVRRAFRMATTVIGITDEYRDWGLEQAGRLASDCDRSFPLGYRSEAPQHAEQQRAEQFWNELRVGTERETFIIAFFGTIGRQFDLAPVIEAARQLQNRRAQPRVIRAVRSRRKTNIFVRWPMTSTMSGFRAGSIRTKSGL